MDLLFYWGIPEITQNIPALIDAGGCYQSPCLELEG